MKCRVYWLLLVLPVVAQAAGEAGRGEDTERWLQVQREGRQASAEPQPATPAEREAAYQRWLDSFRHPIPDFFSDEGGDMTSR